MNPGRSTRATSIRAINCHIPGIDPSAIGPHYLVVFGLALFSTIIGRCSRLGCGDRVWCLRCSPSGWPRCVASKHAAGPIAEGVPESTTRSARA